LRVRTRPAAVAVGKKGAATVTPAELRRKNPAACLARGGGKKSLSPAATSTLILADWRRQGLRVGSTMAVLTFCTTLAMSRC